MQNRDGAAVRGIRAAPAIDWAGATTISGPRCPQTGPASRCPRPMSAGTPPYGVGRGTAAQQPPGRWHARKRGRRIAGAVYCVGACAIRSRINGMRSELVARLKAQGIERDFSFIERQRGMFSFSGLSPKQVATLREQYAIYIVAGGRINVAGLTDTNLGYFCEAIAAVL